MSRRQATAKSARGHSLTAGHHADLLRQMVLIRRFEERCVELYSAGEIHGFVHLLPAAPRHEPPALAVAGTAARAAPAATPLVRHEAAELGVDLVTVHGSGRGGAITRHDVERAAASMRRDRVTPLAWRLAAELGVDLKIVTGTGAGGAVRADDVRPGATAGRPDEEAPGPVTPAPEARLPEVPAREGRQPAGPATTARRPERAEAMRLAIARLMSRSKREIPHYYVSNTVDLGAALSWLRERNRSVPMSARRSRPRCC